MHYKRDEAVATDTIYCNTLETDDGSTSAQIFVGTKTMLTDVCGINSDKQFLRTSSGKIRKRGAINNLISDRAQVEISNKVKDLLRALLIDDWQSEPHS